MKNMSRLKSGAVKDIDINIADTLDPKYRYGIAKGDIDPPLVINIKDNISGSGWHKKTNIMF